MSIDINLQQLFGRMMRDGSTYDEHILTAIHNIRGIHSPPSSLPIHVHKPSTSRQTMESPCSDQQFLISQQLPLGSFGPFTHTSLRVRILGLGNRGRNSTSSAFPL